MISPLAFVDPTAKIGDNVTIYPFAFIDKDVEIGDGCIVMPNASIMQGARLGKNVKVYNNAIVSASPQDFRWKGEMSYVIIGDNTVIREMAIINRSIHEGGATKAHRPRQRDQRPLRGWQQRADCRRCVYRLLLDSFHRRESV